MIVFVVLNTAHSQIDRLIIAHIKTLLYELYLSTLCNSIPRPVLTCIQVYPQLY
jgi:hypothetical protein